VTTTVVLGAGAAGLWCALHATERGAVTVVAPGAAELSATAWAQGGVAAVASEDDAPEQHFADTLAAGGGICAPAAVDVLVREAPAAVAELLAMGMRFDEGHGPALEGGHSRRRVHHAGGDRSGQVLHRFLERTVERDGGIVRVDARAVGIEMRAGAAAGVRVEGGAVIAADRVVLATCGGCGIYGRRTGPDTSVGEGFALAWDAGAALADLEFVQFHPTALNVTGQPRFLLSEALRGEGARLLNAAGERFMERYERAAELAPRDRVARAIVRESERTGAPVFLSLQHLDPDFVHERFPLISKACRAADLDLARDRVPVGPAAHYVMGGVLTDLDGRTSLPGLYAAGEVACTGVHGANRLASNSLLEGLVFGARAGRAMRASRERQWPVTFDNVQRAEESPSSNVRPEAASASVVQDVMWRRVGLFRDRDGLRAALQLLEGAWMNVEADMTNDVPMTSDAWRTTSITVVARLIARAALRREESRGGHYRTDFPQRDDVHWRKRVAETRTL